MATVISLRELVDALDMQSDESVSYLNPETGEITTITEEERLWAEEELDEDAPEWQRQMLPKIREVLTSDRHLVLPDRFDIHEWSIMEQFSLAQQNLRIRQELLGAIHGAGAFRMFRTAIQRLGIEQNRYQFRQEALEQIARDWLEEHKLAYR